MQISGALTLVSNASATGSGLTWNGGKGMFMATATWGGGTVKLQMLMPNLTTWVDVKSPAGNAASLTADGALYFEAPAGQLRANIATSTAVYAYAVGMHQ